MSEVGNHTEFGAEEIRSGISVRIGTELVVRYDPAFDRIGVKSGAAEWRYVDRAQLFDVLEFLTRDGPAAPVTS